MDPMLGWWMLWVLVPSAVVIALTAALLVRRRAPRGDSLTRLESWITALIGTGAMIVGAFSVVALGLSGAQTLTAERLTVMDMPYGGSPVGRLADVEGLANSGYSSVWLEVTGLPVAPRWLLFGQVALPLLATLAISVVVAWLAIAILRDRPFVRALPHAIGVAAIAVLLGGIGGQVAGSLGRAGVVEYLDSRIVTSPTGSSNEALALMVLGLDLAPIGWALGLALVAAAFQIGVRMQKDTEALV